MADISEIRMVKRLNTTLPDPLALYVGEITGKGSLYETLASLSAIWCAAIWKRL